MSNITPFQLRRRFLKIASTTAGLWGLGLHASAQQPAKAEKAPGQLQQLRIG